MLNNMNPIVVLIIVVAFVLLAFYFGYLYRKKIGESVIGGAENLSRQIIDDANKQAEALRRETLIDAKDEISRLKSENEEMLNQARNDLNKREARLIKKEESLDNRSLLIDKKSDQISSDQNKLKQKEEKIDKLIEQQELELQNIAGLTNNEAKEIILAGVKSETIHESARMIKEAEERVKAKSKKMATEVLATTIQRFAPELVAENTVSVISLPNDEMKGRIIGREGRNIRAFEQASGVDLIIDDTPEAVVISCFEPFRREIAKVALEKLIQDGRINPSRIEEMLQKASDEVEARIIEEIRPYITGELSIVEIKREKYSDTFFNDGYRYFKAKLHYITLNEKSGTEKKTPVNMLVQANDMTEAKEIIEAEMKSTMIDYSIVKIEETKIMDVFLYGKEE